MTPKMIFFDIDGTIMDEWGYIPPSAVDAIRGARRKGNLCLVNTGRPYTHIEPFVVDIGFDGYVCSCGSHVILDGKSLFRATVPPRVCDQIVARAGACRLDAYYEAEEGMRYTLLHAPSRGMKIYLDRMAERGFDLSGSPEGFRFDKFCVWAHSDSDFAAFAAYAETYFALIGRGGGMYECVLRGYDKAGGIRAVAEARGIPLADCYAIGDSTNDLPMLSCVPHSIAMAAAPESVRSRVEYVTGELKADGLAGALAHYGLC
ncbi:MAG: HAD family hydrolase [Oscillospiraceae bacterium]